MRICVHALLILLATSVHAQQPNGPNSALNIDGPASASVPAPAVSATLSDYVVTTNIKGFPSALPVVAFVSSGVAPGSSLTLGAFTTGTWDIDLTDNGAAGYGDQLLLNGYATPSPASVTDGAGDLSFSFLVPACTGPNDTVCIPFPDFELGFQAITVDPTEVLGIRSTGAGRAEFRFGFQEFALNGNDFGIFNFRRGFTFKFYGQTYTRAWVSSNGYLSFQPASTGFPNPTVTDVASGTPRVMAFYNDLEPQLMTFGPRVYARQFEENGVRKVKIVHFQLSEFGNATGPHGGEVVLTENGDIAVFVAGYNAQPSIDTAVGITPGNSVDSTPASPTPFGRDLLGDLAAAAALGAPLPLGAGEHGFELFSTFSPFNLLDLQNVGAGNTSGVGPGIVYRPDPMLPNTSPATSGYVIEP